MEYFDVLNEYGEFTGQIERYAMKKDYGIELYMHLYLTKTEMCYCKKEVQTKNYGLIYGISQQEAMYLQENLDTKH